MARGWESKSVESQIQSAESTGSKGTPIRPDPEQARREQERASLMLTRTRVQHDLDAALNPKYREQLEASLRFLDEKIAAI